MDAAAHAEATIHPLGTTFKRTLAADGIRPSQGNAIERTDFWSERGTHLESASRLDLPIGPLRLKQFDLMALGVSDDTTGPPIGFRGSRYHVHGSTQIAQDR